MPKNNSSINNSLFDLLKGKGYSPTMLSTAGKEIPTPDEAEVFQFNFVKDGEDYGKVTLTIDDASNLIVYYSDDVADSEKEASGSGDLSWYGLLNQLKRFAQRYQLSFELRNTDNLKSDMAKRDYMKKQDQIAESKEEKDPIWNKGTPMPKDYTCHCGIHVHPSVRNPKAIHTPDCPYAKKKGMSEGSTGVSVKKWAAQVRQDHGADTKFSNDKVHDRVIARKDKEIVGSYDRKANNGTVFSPKQDVAEGYEGDDRGNYDSTADDAWEASQKYSKSKSPKAHAEAARLHTEAAHYAAAEGKDSSVIQGHQNAAGAHKQAEQKYRLKGVTFKDMAEGYRVVPDIDRERYQERSGLEGPFHAKNGKVVYYDKREGKYYDPNTDMYIDYDDWQAMNEQDMTEGLEDSNIQKAIIDTVEKVFYDNDIQDYGSLEAIRQGVKHRFSKPGATTKSAIEGILDILNKRMIKRGIDGNLVRFKEALSREFAHQLKKQGEAEGYYGDDRGDYRKTAGKSNSSFIITAKTAEGDTKKYRVKAQNSDMAKEKFVQHHSMAEILDVKEFREQGVAESNQQVNESYYPMGKQGSYSDAVPTTKIIIQHSRRIEEGEQRYRNIAKIFVENSEGERFVVPTKKPGLARVHARHIAEGGTPYDERGCHITSLIEEYSKMSGFMRATRGKQFNESAQQLVTEAVNYYQSLRESLSKMTGHRGYSAYFESWTPALMEDGEEQETNLNELFVQETLDPRIESVMPILGKLQRKLGNIKQVDELAEWADNIIEDWKGELAGGTLGGVGGTLAGSELGALAGGPVGAAIGAVVGGAAGGTAGQMAGRKLTDKDQLNEFAPLLAAGARAIIPLLSRIGPTLGQMASSAGKAGAGVAGKTATGIGRGAVDVAKSAAQSVAQNAGKVGVGVGAYQAITDVANSVIGGVGEVYRDVGKATIAIAQAVGNAVDRNTITELANAAVKYSIPIGILLAVLYGGKKLIDQVLSEEIDDSVAGFAGKLVGDITPNPNDFVAGFKKTFEGANESVNESEDELARILQMVKHKR